jgi:hypothetical protein
MEVGARIGPFARSLTGALAARLQRAQGNYWQHPFSCVVPKDRHFEDIQNSGHSFLRKQIGSRQWEINYFAFFPAFLATPFTASLRAFAARNLGALEAGILILAFV